MHTGAYLVVCVFVFAFPLPVVAGMPAPLPVNPDRVTRISDWSLSRLQAISFFLLVFLLSAVAIRAIWNYLQRDFPSLPRLSYGRALAGVFLWGLLFVIVLTMISGARELMTPGAWRKQGATYILVDNTIPPAQSESDPGARRLHLERLRTALWQFAATHDGRFPGPGEMTTVPAELWEVPGAGGLRYLYVGGRSAGYVPNVLAYEPEFDSGPAARAQGERRYRGNALGRGPVVEPPCRSCWYAGEKAVRTLTIVALVAGFILLAVVTTIDGPFVILFGWIPFLERVLPEVKPDGPSVVVGALALLLFGAGVHWFGRSWRGTANLGGRWRIRWTVAIVLGVVLLFTAGISVVGISHQVAWLATSEQPIVGEGLKDRSWEGSSNELKMIGMGLANYADTNNSTFPPSGTFSTNGEMLHSWETHILPYIGYASNEIDKNRPWNGPENQRYFKCVFSPRSSIRSSGRRLLKTATDSDFEPLRREQQGHVHVNKPDEVRRNAARRFEYDPRRGSERGVQAMGTSDQRA